MFKDLFSASVAVLLCHKQKRSEVMNKPMLSRPAFHSATLSILCLCGGSLCNGCLLHRLTQAELRNADDVVLLIHTHSKWVNCINFKL